MSEQKPGDDAQSLVDKHARACLADFLHVEGGSCPAVAITRCPGATVIVAAFPPVPDHDAPDLSECDQAVLTLLAGRTINVPAPRIRDELETRGLYVCSLDTIKRSLRKLKGLRLIVSSKRKPRGYHLPDDIPLFLFRDDKPRPVCT
jgi:hypothetical protein